MIKDAAAFAKDILGVSLTPLQERVLKSKGELRMLTSHEMYQREKFCELLRICKEYPSTRVLCKDEAAQDKLVAAGVKLSQTILSDGLFHGYEITVISTDEINNSTAS